MRRRVRLDAAFADDVRAQLEWLARNRNEEWIEGLRQGIDEAIELLGDFPAAGVVIERDGSHALRKLILRRLPFVAWYSVDESVRQGDVWLLRLFHARQDRPLPAQRPRRRH